MYQTWTAGSNTQIGMGIPEDQEIKERNRPEVPGTGPQQGTDRNGFLEPDKITELIRTDFWNQINHGTDRNGFLEPENSPDRIETDHSKAQSGTERNSRTASKKDRIGTDGNGTSLDKGV